MSKYICTGCGETFDDWDELVHEAYCPDCGKPVEDFNKAFKRVLIDHALKEADPELAAMWREFQCMALGIRPVCITVNFEAPGPAGAEA